MEQTKHLDTGRFREDLLNWYDRVKRDLPWRINQDPYRILVSEIMLQQTQVATVIPYYERFLKQFPTPKELAAAQEEELLKAWEGLGYYSRVRNLQKAAQMIQELGSFPATHEEILKLKGVGPYTAGAVGSIAFGLAVPAVDGNVFRVLSRICVIFEDIMKPKTRKIFEAAARELVDPKKPGDFNQALMELGATICTPKSPKCQSCPVQRHCLAYAQGIDDLLPVKSKAGKQQKIPLVVGLIEDRHGKIMLQKRPPHGLLSNFYEFPTIEFTGEGEPEEVLRNQLASQGFQILDLRPLGTYQHVFSHRIWEMEAFNVQVETSPLEEVAEDTGIWIKEEGLAAYPLVTAHQKIHKDAKRESNHLTKS